MVKNWEFVEDLQVEGNSFGSGYPGGDANSCAMFRSWLLFLLVIKFSICIGKDW